MRKPKAAAILGVLILCGLVVLTSVTIAAGDAKLEAAFLRGCSDVLAVLPVVPDFFDACALVVHALTSLKPSSIFSKNKAADPEEIATAIIDEIGRQVDASTCDECVELVQDFENTLAANLSDQGIQEALEAGCEKRFSSPVQANRCRELAAKIPDSIDFVLGNFPPLLLCRQLNLCPL